jgi:hypothetical protein
MTPEQEDARMKRNFIGETACMDNNSSVKRVQTLKNVFGHEVKRSYLFVCGQEKYACVSTYHNSSYQWYFRCNPKISSI